MTDGPGGYVVITFSSPEPDWCTWPACPMSAEWFPDDESATRYMAGLPAWTDPHRLPVSDLAYHRQERKRDEHPSIPGPQDGERQDDRDVPDLRRVPRPPQPPLREERS